MNKLYCTDIAYLYLIVKPCATAKYDFYCDVVDIEVFAANYYKLQENLTKYLLTLPYWTF